MPDDAARQRDPRPTEAAGLDAAYASFADFTSWPVATPGPTQWAYWSERLRDARARTPQRAFARLRERTLRTAAIDTGAIEGLYDTDRGFTMTVAAMAAGWTEEVESQKGAEVARTVAAQRAAFDLALDVVSGSTPPSEAWVRRVHEEVCAAQDTYTVRTPVGPQQRRLRKGEYKTDPNHVERADGGRHAYAPVDLVGDEMHRLLTEMRSSGFAQAHPVVQAAFAHHALTTIHPFADGNGRVARVLASVFLLRAASIPFVVFADQAASYFDALAHADRGRHDRFVRFVSDRALDTLALLAEELLDDGGEEVTQAADSLRASTERAQSSGLVALDVAAHTVVDVAMRATTDLLDRHVPDALSAEVTTFSTTPFADVDGLRTAGDGLGGYFVRIAGAGSLGVGRQVDVRLLVDARPSAPFAVRLHSVSDVVAPLDVRLSEVHPRPTGLFHRRVSVWAQRLVSTALGSVDRQVRQRLQPPE